MASDDTREKKRLKDTVEERRHPAPSKAAAHEERALEVLAALLESESETIRLQAAQAILHLPKAPAPDKPVAALAKKLKKVRS